MAWLGVDGGGTKTEALVVCDRGWGFARGEPSNHQIVGMESALDAASSVSEAALRDHGLNWGDVEGAVFGLAGADFPEDVSRLTEGLKERLPLSSLTVVNDAEIALPAGTDADSGIAVIAGTYTNVFGLSPDGEKRQVGGLGYEWGDYGGGIDIAREVLHQAFRSAELRGEKTVLEDLVLQLLGLPDYASLSRALYFKEIPETHFFVVVPFCFQAANAGDRVAQRILAKNGRALAESVVGCARLLRMHAMPTRVVMAGSLWLGQAPHLQDAFLSHLREALPLAEAKVTEFKPVVGAVIAASRNGGQDSAAMRDRLRQDARLTGVE